MNSSAYIHGTDPEEQQRLSLMNTILNDASFRQAAIRPGERIVDFGCGLGQLVRRMAAAAGVSAVGIDRSDEQIGEARRLAEMAGESNLIDFRVGDVFEPPLGDGETFDLAHARFLLEHVPRPGKVVERMVASLRPGGRIILEDDDHDILRLWPEAPAVMLLWEAYMATYALLGNDAAAGRKLPALIAAAGAEPVKSDWLFFGACRGGERFEAIVANLAGILKGARETISRFGLIPPSGYAAGMEELKLWSGEPGASLWFAMAWAEGRKRG